MISQRTDTTLCLIYRPYWDVLHCPNDISIAKENLRSHVAFSGHFLLSPVILFPSWVCLRLLPNELWVKDTGRNTADQRWGPPHASPPPGGICCLLVHPRQCLLWSPGQGGICHGAPLYSYHCAFCHEKVLCGDVLWEHVHIILPLKLEYPLLISINDSCLHLIITTAGKWWLF